MWPQVMPCWYAMDGPPGQKIIRYVSLKNTTVNWSLHDSFPESDCLLSRTLGWCLAFVLGIRGGDCLNVSLEVGSGYWMSPEVGSGYWMTLEVGSGYWMSPQRWRVDRLEKFLKFLSRLEGMLNFYAPPIHLPRLRPLICQTLFIDAKVKIEDERGLLCVSCTMWIKFRNVTYLFVVLVCCCS